MKGGYKRNGRRWDQKVSRGLVCRAKKPMGIRVQGEWWGVRCPSQRSGGHQGEVKSQPCRDCCHQATQEPEPSPGLSQMLMLWAGSHLPGQMDLTDSFGVGGRGT